jgi:hypothetical protein
MKPIEKFSLYLLLIGALTDPMTSGQIFAETVHMKDGRIINGEILDQSNTDIKIHLSTGTQWLSKYTIDRIIFNPAPVSNQKTKENSLAAEKKKQLKAENIAKKKRLAAEKKRLREAKNQRLATERDNQRIEAEKKAEEKRLATERDNQRIEAEKKDEEKRLATERDNQRIEAEKKDEEKRLATERDNQRIEAEKKDEEKRLATERLPEDQSKKSENNLNRQSINFSLGYVKGRQHTLSQLIDEEISRKLSTIGQFTALNQDNPTTDGADLKLTTLRSSWRFGFGAGYRSAKIGSDWKTIHTDAALPQYLEAASDGTSFSWSSDFSLEREFFRKERSSLGLGLNLGILDESSSLNGRGSNFIIGSSPGIMGGMYQQSSFHSVYYPLRFDAHWHIYKLAGGELDLSAGWVSANGKTFYKMESGTGYTSGDFDTMVSDSYFKSYLSGPAISLGYIRPFSKSWSFLFRIYTERLHTEVTSAGGFIIPAGTAMNAGNNLSLIPVSIFGPNGIPSLVPSSPMYETRTELTLGIQLRLK